MNLFEPQNKVWPQKESLLVRRECQSCFIWFDTDQPWNKRCKQCRGNNEPYRKKIINETADPF